MWSPFREVLPASLLDEELVKWLPFPLQCTAVRALVLCFGFVSNSGRPGFFDENSKLFAMDV
jgi:hypothetical protein